MRRFGRAVAVLGALLAGCAGGEDAATSTVPGTVGLSRLPPATAPETTASTASTASTAATSTTSTTTTSTTLPSTTLAPLPVPMAPPPEDGSTEPLVEVGLLEIPAIGLSRTIFEGIRLSTLDSGPGHWPGTAMPGELGNVVLAGHRVSKHRDFNRLDRLQPGDEVIMSTLSGRHVYRVTGTEIVQPNAMWIVDQTHARTATLFACHPPGSVRERIVVHLELGT